MLKGFHLTLMMGVGVASPVPRRVIESLVSAQVTETAGRSGFQLVFTWAKGSPIECRRCTPAAAPRASGPSRPAIGGRTGTAPVPTISLS